VLKNPNLLWICFFFFGLETGRRIFKQMNKAIEQVYKEFRSTNIPSAKLSQFLLMFFYFLGIKIISGAVGKGGKSLFEKDIKKL
jgi:hypothetical protein